MKRLLGAAALATVIALSPACGRERPKATFNNRAPITDTEKAVRMADDREKLAIVPKKAQPVEDAGATLEKPSVGQKAKLPPNWGFEELRPKPVEKREKHRLEPRIH